MSAPAAKLSLALLLAAASTALVAWPPADHRPAPFRVTRHPRGDRLFRGKPVSYWREKVQRGELTLSGWTGSVCVENKPPWWLRGPWWTRVLLQLVGVPTSWERETFFPCWQAQNHAFALLFVDLLREDDPGVRELAAVGLGSYGHGRHRDGAAEALTAALADEDEDVRWQAARSLRRAGLESGPRVRRRVEEILRQGQGKEHISLAASDLTDKEMEPMSRWTNLVELNAPHSEVTDAGLAHLAGLRRLACLDLRGTRVTDAGLAHLAKVTSLYRLDLGDTAVTDAGLTHLKGLPRLKDLNLAGTRVTEAGAADLQRALPGLKITR
jgi:hypothetical protein